MGGGGGGWGRGCTSKLKGGGGGGGDPQASLSFSTEKYPLLGLYGNIYNRGGSRGGGGLTS